MCPMTVPRKVILGFKTAGTSAQNQKKSEWASGPGNGPSANQAGASFRSRSASPFSGCLQRTGSGVGTAVSDEDRCSLGPNVGRGGGGRGKRKGSEEGHVQPNAIATGPLYLILFFIMEIFTHTHPSKGNSVINPHVPSASFQKNHFHFVILISFSPRASFFKKKIPDVFYFTYKYF